MSELHPRIANTLGMLGAVLSLLVTVSPASAADPSAPDPTRLCLAILTDRSGSYKDFDTARRLMAASVAQLQGGDSLLVRWICADSYSASEVVIDRTLPAVSMVRNSLSPAERRRSRHDQLRVQRAKHDLMALLARIPLARSSHTNVWGAIRAAQEWRDATPCDRTVFVVISDVQHNRGVVPELRLDGVEIMVAGFEHDGDFTRAEATRSAFRRRVEAAGAKARFLPPRRVPKLRDHSREGDR